MELAKRADLAKSEEKMPFARFQAQLEEPCKPACAERRQLKGWLESWLKLTSRQAGQAASWFSLANFGTNLELQRRHA